MTAGYVSMQKAGIALTGRMTATAAKSGKGEREMNKVCLMGRLTRDPDIRYTQGENTMCIARFTMAVDRRWKKDGQPAADFLGCTVFGKSAEAIEKYVHKGTKLCLDGHLQTGSYTDRDGRKVYTTDVIVDEWEFAESRKAQEEAAGQAEGKAGTEEKAPEDADGFMNIPDSIDEELPFN